MSDWALVFNPDEQTGGDAVAFDTSISNLKEDEIFPLRYLERFNGLDFAGHKLFRFDSESYNLHKLKRWDGQKWAPYNA